MVTLANDLGADRTLNAGGTKCGTRCKRALSRAFSAAMNARYLFLAQLRSRARERSRSFGRLAIALSIGCALVIAVLGDGDVDEFDVLLILSGALVVALKLAADRFTATTGMSRRRLLTAHGLLGVTPWLLAYAADALNPRLLTISFCGCTLGSLLEDAHYLLVIPMFAATSGLVSVLVAKSSSPRVSALLRGTSCAAFGLLLLLLALGAAHRAARDTDAEQYIASLPEVGIVPPVGQEPVAVIPQRATSQGEHGTSEIRIYDDPIGALIVRRSCASGVCDLHLRASGAPAPTDVSLVLPWNEVQETRPLSIRRDETHDIWIVGDDRAYRGTDLRRIALDASTVADSVRPPRAGVLLGALGALIALLPCFARRRLAERLHRLAAARTGFQGADGWITLEDGVALRAPPGLDLPEGPALLVPRSLVSSPGLAYRSSGAPSDMEIVPGTREDAVAALRRRMAALDATLLDVAVLAAIPLAAAWKLGFFA